MGYRIVYGEKPHKKRTGMLTVVFFFSLAAGMLLLPEGGRFAKRAMGYVRDSYLAGETMAQELKDGAPFRDSLEAFRILYDRESS